MYLSIVDLASVICASSGGEMVKRTRQTPSGIESFMSLSAMSGNRDANPRPDVRHEPRREGREAAFGASARWRGQASTHRRGHKVELTPAKIRARTSSRWRALPLNLGGWEYRYQAPWPRQSWRRRCRLAN